MSPLKLKKRCKILSRLHDSCDSDILTCSELSFSKVSFKCVLLLFKYYSMYHLYLWCVYKITKLFKYFYLFAGASIPTKKDRGPTID